ncbi:hypothetical protein [Carboxylicivirga sp. N1Y90]|uniref:hypothetical protein n=1 Tax=Carboxylicivirga fragile TaxID=3417571 RepID=UPI003D342374|nr:hypothetical protein [Marinilabiliaceae bacterium N1Y90]
MSFSENSFNEQKNQLRIEAMEKEVQRLRTSSQKQSAKIGTLRRSLYLQIVFFVSLLSILMFKGLIQFPNSNGAIDKTSAEVENTVQKDTLTKVETTPYDTLSHIVYNTHKGALPKEGYDGIIFAIQIGAYTGIDLEPYEDNLLGIKQDSYEGINQFTLGEFIDYTEAESFLDQIKQMGFKDAFIMSFKNGRRIQIQNAIAMHQKNKAQVTEEKKEEELEPINDDLVNNLTQKESITTPVSNDGIQL